MRPGDRIAAVSVVAACVAAPIPARAQSADAEALFRDGRRLIKLGRIADGCDKIEASAQLEAAVGALLNLGDCRDKLGKLASAWAAFRKAEAIAKQSRRDRKRQAEAGRRAAALEPKLSNLVIEVEQPVAGLVVRRDDMVVVEAAWKLAVPVDPDIYVVTANAPGYKPWRCEVPIHPETRRRVVTIPKLEPAAVAPPIVRDAEPRPARRPTNMPPQAIVAPAIRRHAWTWKTTRQLAAALAGAGSTATGIYLGLRVSDR